MLRQGAGEVADFDHRAKRARRTDEQTTGSADVSAPLRTDDCGGSYDYNLRAGDRLTRRRSRETPGSVGPGRSISQRPVSASSPT
jgi:hypothetical protein